ncbi:MAG: AI-2E family transporter, partial [Gammaproteobacteria bacterium]|nr:AI-2E family transporter [Gammaproteobacteria bacterium]
RLPASVQYTLAFLLIALAFTATFWLVVLNLGRLVELAPAYQATLLAVIQDVAARVGIESQPTWATLRQDYLSHVSPQRLLTAAAATVSSVASGLVVGVLYVAFLLLELRAVPKKLANLSDDPAAVAQVEKVLTRVNDRIGTYLALKTMVCLLTGFVSWVVMAGLGLELAAFWAVLIALVNYVPYIGSFLGVVVPASFGLLQFGLGSELLLLLVLLAAAQLLIGNVLDPYLMANSLNLSAFAILASLATWSALWGISGAFLAVPLTACIAMVLAEFRGTRPIAVLLSKTGRVDEE